MLLFVASVCPPSILHAQQNASAGDGDRLFATNCAACHGSDGHGGERAPSIATLRNVIAMSDTDLEGIVSKGIAGAGMPGFGYLGDQKVHNIVEYLRILQGRGPAMKVKGDPAKGRALFYGKAGCSKCHMVNGQGGFIADDLSTYGDGLSAAAVRRAIVQPNLDLEPTSRVVEIYTKDGGHISGLLRAEDNFTVYLQTEDGRYHTYPKTSLRSVQHTARSIMPDNYDSVLSSTELDDLVSYLITTASGPTSAPRPRKKGDDDDE
jgi:putative heme-binding domain-containing protein